MHFLIDNLVASIIAGSIFMILVGVSHRNQQAAFESVNFYAMRQQQIAFVDLLKRDMQNVTRIETAAEVGTDFVMHVTDPGTSNENRVIYRREAVSGTDFYRIQRYVETSPGVIAPSGRSPETVSFWHIRARNAASQAVSDPDAATQIYVKFEMGAPYREGRTVKRARWDAAFRPPMIQPNVSL
jgi:hypothetical protein